MNHVTVGVYANGETKVNIVEPADLESHIDYNRKNRFGRALFVDGKCIYDGCHLNQQQMKEWEEKIARMKIDNTLSSAIYT